MQFNIPVYGGPRLNYVGNGDKKAIRGALSKLRDAGITDLILLEKSAVDEEK